MRGEELVAGAIFLGIYALIVTEKIHRTLAALLGGSLVILLKLVDQREAFAFVDFNVIFLLAGMMIIANVMAKTGIFQWIAVEAVRRAEGRPYRLLLLTSVITAVVSAFLDNVTTVVLLTPITFFVAQRLGTSPVPFLISQVIASNIGGTATLIGDPPNIIIGSQMGKDFNDFLLNLAPAATAAACFDLRRIHIRRLLLSIQDLPQTASGAWRTQAPHSKPVRNLSERDGFPTRTW